jgi:hypothetical protein
MRGPIYLTLAALLCSQAVTAIAQRHRIERSCPEIFEMHKDGGRQVLRYASNHSLDKTDTAIRTLLVYIHGLHRNAMGYYEYGDEAVRAAHEKKTTLLIAPQYTNDEDMAAMWIGKEFVYWHKAEWKDGYESVHDETGAQRAGMSSYEVMDSLIAAVVNSDRFPNLRRVVVAGHSAGGQFVDRYSAISPLPDLLTGVRFRFIVMNPSSYLYPDNLRPAEDGNFVVPDSSACPGYNRYPKGMTDLNSYARAIGAERILQNMLQRDIVFLLGGDDTNMEDPDLDVSCAGNMQGKYRLIRGMYYIGHIGSFPGYGGKKNFSIIRGVGHEGDMISTAEARKWVFEW